MEEIVKIEKLFDICNDDLICMYADFDCDEPYVILVDKNDYTFEESRVKVLIPQCIAYYLRTHFCGSNKYLDGVEKRVEESVKYNIRKALGIEND